jgi:hypothetical protein
VNERGDNVRDSPLTENLALPVSFIWDASWWRVLSMRLFGVLTTLERAEPPNAHRIALERIISLTRL